MTRLDSLVARGPSNATIAWLLVAGLVASTVERLLAGDPLSAGFSATVVTVALVPAVLSRDPTVMVSWPVLLLSALPPLARVLGVFVQPLAYLSVAALGLLVVAEIDRFTSARMPPWFAVAMVVMATMSVASTWAAVRYLANVALGTDYFTTAAALMWDLVAASATGVLAGVAFEAAFRAQEAT